MTPAVRERSEAPQTPTTRLARGLRRAFERLGQGVSLPLRVAAGHLEVSRHLQRNLRLTTGQSGVAVRCDEGGLMLYRDHRLVSAALARAEEDPLLLSLLLSAVYTAVNLHLEQVTDDHENAFLEALTAGVLADLGQPGSDQDLRIPRGEVT